MKKLILISALLFSFNVWTQVTDDVHKKCKDVADYIGCVQIFTGANFTNNDSKADLERSLRLLPRRLENTVLRDFSNAIEPFIDALSIAEGDKRLADTKLLSDSMKIEKALYIARKAWDDSIEADVAFESNLSSINSKLGSLGSLGSSSLGSMASDLSNVNTINMLNSCRYLNNAVHNFNMALGGLVMDYPCDIKQSCVDNNLALNDVRQTIHSRMLLHIADAAKDASNSEVLDYPSIESIEPTTQLDCENEKKRLAEEKAIKDRERREEREKAAQAIRDEEALTNQELWEYLFIGDDMNDCKTFKMRISMPKTTVNNETAANFKRVCGEKEGELFDWAFTKEALEMRKKARERSK